MSKCATFERYLYDASLSARSSLAQSSLPSVPRPVWSLFARLAADSHFEKARPCRERLPQTLAPGSPLLIPHDGYHEVTRPVPRFDTGLRA